MMAWASSQIHSLHLSQSLLSHVCASDCVAGAIEAAIAPLLSRCEERCLPSEEAQLLLTLQRAVQTDKLEGAFAAAAAMRMAEAGCASEALRLLRSSATLSDGIAAQVWVACGGLPQRWTAD
eukprot:gnl/TRDRNA2_/TRDRNA2_175562_c0_seq3.p1 gnl/TRDRNA2_/TRDRNA2_175562_c0~~gnl/TRDRNA2_/TRDRNA2_175562_c0_seq3.p1  ORF type:complete len:122 (+),score=21.91 gnl/TRDRNA2_/TRDRNA2_175562_c0_seq3:761-1126(+)